MPSKTLTDIKCTPLKIPRLNIICGRF